MNLKVLQEKRGAKVKEANAILNTAKSEKRELSADEQTKLEGLQGEIESLDRQIQIEVRSMAQNATTQAPLSQGEQRSVDKFSFTRMCHLLAMGRALDGVEAEMTQEGLREAREAGCANKGHVVPLVCLRNAVQPSVSRSMAARFMREMRDMTATGTTSVSLDQGGMTIATEKGTMLEALFEQLVLGQAGATVLTGLVGNIDLPRIIKGTEPTEKSEVAQATEYTPTTLMLSLTPNRLPTVVEVTNQLLAQSNNRSLDSFLQGHLARLLRVRMEKMALHGTGGSNTPVGVFATSGIGAIFAGGAATDIVNANGAAPVWADIINLETEVAVDDADVGSLAYLFNARVRGALKKTPRVSSTDSMMIMDDRSQGMLNGYRPLVTNCVSRTLSKGGSGATLSGMVFGNWADLILAQWGGLDILVNPYTKDDTGIVRINAAIFYSSGVVRPESFAAGDDFIA